MSVIDVKFQTDLYQSFLKRCRQYPNADRQRIFSEIYGLTHEDLTYLVHNGGLLIHEEMATLKKTFRAYRDLPIESAVKATLVATEERYPTGDSLVVKMYPMSPQDTFGIERLGGVSGWTDWDGHTMELVVHPAETSFFALQSTVVHEYHHHYRIRKTCMTDSNISLLESLVREGMAEHFVKEILGEQAAGPWVNALSESDAKELWYSRYQEHLEDRGDATNSYVFGGGDSGLPLWAGYSLGYHMVGWYRASHPGIAMTDLSTTRAQAFLDTVRCR